LKKQLGVQPPLPSDNSNTVGEIAK